MTYHVVDTNVALVANNKAPQANPQCVLACIEMLETIIQSGGVVLDEGMFILQEYLNNLHLAGQPGVGDAFFRWVWQHQAREDVCARVRITEDESRGFAEFPDDARLDSFDQSDRKFVAVALTCRHQPEILNAVDSDWWHHRHALRDCGVNVRFLCPRQFGERE